MIRRGWLIVLCFGVTAAAGAQDAIQGRVRAGLDVEPPLWVAQGVRLSIDMLSTGFIFSNQDYAIPDVPRALVMQDKSSAVNLTERVGTETWQALRYQMQIYPQRSGEIVIPAIDVSFSVSSGFGQPAQDFSFRTEELRFQAMSPPGADPGIPVVTSDDFELSQVWEPEPVDLLAGHAIKRRIIMSAEGIPGMVLPPLRTSEMDGVAVYASDPRVTATSNRGKMSGERIEEADLVFEQPGTFEIPGASIQWWRPSREELTLVEINSLVLEVAPNPALGADNAGQGQAFSDPGRWGWQLLIALMVAVILFRVSPTVLRRFRSWQTRRANSEPAHFTRLKKACLGNNPGTAYVMLHHWRARASLIDLEEQGSLSNELRRLQEAVADRDMSWDDRALLRELTAERRSSLKSTREQAVLLPPLNPH